MTIKEAILKSLEDLGKPSNHKDIYKNILKFKYYDFRNAKTPESTISALLGDFIRKNDTRIQRIKSNSIYFYYLSKNNLNIENFNNLEVNIKDRYKERDLHKLL